MGFTQQKFSGSPTSSVGDGGTGQYFALNNFAYGDDFTWQHGRHLIKRVRSSFATSKTSITVEVRARWER